MIAALILAVILIVVGTALERRDRAKRIRELDDILRRMREL